MSLLVLWCCAGALGAEPLTSAQIADDWRLQARMDRDRVVVGTGLALAVAALPAGAVVSERAYPDSPEGMAAALLGAGVGALGLVVGLTTATVGGYDLSVAHARRERLRRVSVAIGPGGVYGVF